MVKSPQPLNAGELCWSLRGEEEADAAMALFCSLRWLLPGLSSSRRASQADYLRSDDLGAELARREGLFFLLLFWTRLQTRFPR